MGEEDDDCLCSAVDGEEGKAVAHVDSDVHLDEHLRAVHGDGGVDDSVLDSTATERPDACVKAGASERCAVVGMRKGCQTINDAEECGLEGMEEPCGGGGDDDCGD